MWCENNVASDNISKPTITIWQLFIPILLIKCLYVYAFKAMQSCRFTKWMVYTETVPWLPFYLHSEFLVLKHTFKNRTSAFFENGSSYQNVKYSIYAMLFRVHKNMYSNYK